MVSTCGRVKKRCQTRNHTVVSCLACVEDDEKSSTTKQHQRRCHLCSACVGGQKKRYRARNHTLVGVVSCLACGRVCVGSRRNDERCRCVQEFMEKVDKEEILLVTLAVNKINKNWKIRKEKHTFLRDWAQRPKAHPHRLRGVPCCHRHCCVMLLWLRCGGVDVVTSVWKSGPVRSFGLESLGPGPRPVLIFSDQTKNQTEPVWTGPERFFVVLKPV